MTLLGFEWRDVRAGKGKWIVASTYMVLTVFMGGMVYAESVLGDHKSVAIFLVAHMVNAFFFGCALFVAVEFSRKRYRYRQMTSYYEQALREKILRRIDTKGATKQ